jgi:hypothetical protein
MAEATKIPLDELEDLIERKLLEILGDPDSGLRLRPEFKKRIAERMDKPSKRVTHRDVMKRFG